MDFFDSLSSTSQIFLVFIGLAILFLIVFANNKRNKNKLYHRKRRNFKENYEAKRKSQKE